MRWIKGLVAAVTLLAISVVPPLLLIVFVGNPIPSDLGATSELSDQTLIKLLSAIVWLLWAQTVWCVGVEAVAAVRSADLKRTPGTFALQQHFARTLVGAVLAAAVTTPVLTSGAVAATAGVSEPFARDISVSAVVMPEGSAEEPLQTSQTEAGAGAVQRTDEVRVGRGDSLWSIAESLWGDGDRWSEIAGLNEGRVMNDGRIFRSSHAIQPGWHLLVPGQQEGSDGAYIVKPGDTLSEIAQEQVGDASAWPELFEQSADLDQPLPLTNPDQIYPGQRIDLPNAGPAASLGASAKAPSTPEDAQRPVERDVISPRVAEGDAAFDRAPGEASTSASVPAARAEAPVEDGGDERLPGWILPGLLGGGSLLAGSLLLALRSRRAMQHRMRRPGRTISAAGPGLVDVEKSITVGGRTTLGVVELVDGLLKRTASVLAAKGLHLPVVAAIEVSPTALALHLREPDLGAPAPWGVTDDGLTWIIKRDIELDAVAHEDADAPAPWPLLVTVGQDGRGHTWLLNFEDHSVTVTGDPVATRDFARFVAAEIACNPWSTHTTLDLVGVAEEIAVMQPERVCVHESALYAASGAVADAVSNTERLSDYGVDTPTARAQQRDPDPWLARVLMVDGGERSDEIGQLAGLLSDHSGRRGAAVVLVGDREADGFEIHVGEGRKMTIPALNLSCTAVGLTSSEAQGCAALLAQAESAADQALPDLDGNENWKQMATAGGSLRDQFTVSRSASTLEPSASLLSAADEAYIESAATTVEDLESLAPKVAESVRDAVLEADLTLDADVADWFADACSRPRLALLGPVGARTKGKALDRRKPFYTELFAYLATRPYGATTDEVAAAFDITPARVRIDINKLRDWLGTNPVTGAKHLPDARLAPSALKRGIGVYEIVDALVDVDLFRRLRIRAESRGPDGIEDLRRALELVAGRPFQKLRTGGWTWLLEGDRLDLHMTCAIVDVAHLVANHGLQTDNVDLAKSAAALSAAAAPEEEIPRLDLAAVLDAQGHTAEAEQMLRDDVCNREDEEEAPTELSARTERIIDSRHWLRRNAV